MNPPSARCNNPLAGSGLLGHATSWPRLMIATADEALGSLQSGGRLAAALAKAAVLPPLAIELITVGEESGQLEEMLAKTAETFEARVQQTLKRLLTLLEPSLILGLGAIIALVIVSILMAMLGLNDLVA
jgi:general secretion pathway protein F